MQADARAQQRVLLRQVERLCKGRHVLRGGRRIVAFVEPCSSRIEH